MKAGERESLELALSLIIPTYNEAHNLSRLLAEVCAVLDVVLPWDYEIVVVDDNSRDRTWAVALELMEHYPQLRVMRRTQERGLSTAVIRGWQVAQGRLLGVIDGDLQHPPATLESLVQALGGQGVDLAVASRHVRGGGTSQWSLVRRVLSRGAQLLGLVLLPGVVGRVSDPMSGYFVVRREAIAAVDLDPQGYKILLEVLGRGRVQRIVEVGYVFQERQSGASKVTWRQYLEYLHHLLSLRFGVGGLGMERLGAEPRAGRFLPLGQRFQLERFLRFGLVGLSGVVVDMAMLWLLSDPSMLGWGLTRSKVLASELAIANNFLWNDCWTFGDVAAEQPALRQRLKRFLKFNGVCLIGLGLNVLTLNLLFNQFGFNRYLANLVAIALVTAWNFWVNLKLNWRVTEVDITTQGSQKVNG